MRLFVGLGNPGKQYQLNRHNIGFMALDVIVERHKFSDWEKKFQGLVSTGNLGGEKVLLLKPQTFMNVSGQSVQAAAAFYKILPDDIVVFHDELDLAPGKLRVKKGGGAAGHNGLRSIDEHLGQMYWRVRLGIGHPGMKEMVSGYVLGNFGSVDEKWLVPLLSGIGENAERLAKGDTAGFMSKVAQEVEPPKPKEPKEPKIKKEQEEKTKEVKDGI
ncbi:MAG: aminoacyl-tRNA hydrolase [Alphaproteobacteria bacterium]|jgi:PTH1 family peptidyl-tRNA hydrolase|nr:aminoacyl-tRNA hydrolase [Alphaproteobacteria bacterium]